MRTEPDVTLGLDLPHGVQTSPSTLQEGGRDTVSCPFHQALLRLEETVGPPHSSVQSWWCRNQVKDKIEGCQRQGRFQEKASGGHLVFQTLSFLFWRHLIFHPYLPGTRTLSLKGSIRGRLSERGRPAFQKARTMYANAWEPESTLVHGQPNPGWKGRLNLGCEMLDGLDSHQNNSFLNQIPQLSRVTKP